MFLPLKKKKERKGKKDTSTSALICKDKILEAKSLRPDNKSVTSLIKAFPDSNFVFTVTSECV
jgi:hypothetical protein